MTAASSRWGTEAREASDPPAVSRQPLPTKPCRYEFAKVRGADGFIHCRGVVVFHSPHRLVGGVNLSAPGRSLPDISAKRNAFSIRRRFSHVPVQRRHARPSFPASSVFNGQARGVCRTKDGLSRAGPPTGARWFHRPRARKTGRPAANPPVSSAAERTWPESRSCWPEW